MSTCYEEKQISGTIFSGSSLCPNTCAARQQPPAMTLFIPARSWWIVHSWVLRRMRPVEKTSNNSFWLIGHSMMRSDNNLSKMPKAQLGSTSELTRPLRAPLYQGYPHQIFPKPFYSTQMIHAQGKPVLNQPLETNKLGNQINLCYSGAPLVAQMIMNLPVMQETQVQSLDQEDPLEDRKGFPLQYLCMENSTVKQSGWLQSMGSHS